MLYLILALVALGLISAIFGIISHRKGEDERAFAGRSFSAIPATERTPNANRNA